MSRQPEPRRVLVVRYLDQDGRPVPKGTKGARRVRERSRVYYATIDRRRYSLGTEDLGAAWEELRRLQRRLAGDVSDTYLEQARRPLADHLSDWLESLRHKGTEEQQVVTMGARLRLLADLAGWRRVTDLTAASLLAALNRLTTEPGLAHTGSGPGKGGRGSFARTLSPQTRNHYLSHAKQFARWCCEVQPRRLRENPFAGLKPVSVESDRRHDRRNPTDAEIGALFLSLETAPVRCGMTGPQRALGYRVAMATGFRAGELRSLSLESFDLEAGTVTVRAAYSKRRRRDVQQLPAWLVADLCGWFAAGGGTWEGFPERHPGRVLRDDLERAGVAYRVDGPDGPQFLDCHSLRVWYCTAVANQPGISPKTLLELCRHSTPALSLRVYARARISDLKAAAEAIPDPTAKLEEPGQPRQA